MKHDLAVQLGDHLDRFIQDEVARGRFRSPSEVVETALLLLEEREARLAKLRAAFDESGPSRKSLVP
jgi:antitoxin ParD1/3/4